jgi:hypothetical protein
MMDWSWHGYRCSCHCRLWVPLEIYLARSERQEYVYLRPIRLLNKSYGQSEKSFSSIVTMMECPIADFRDDGVIEHIEQFQMDDVCKDLLTYHV